MSDFSGRLSKEDAQTAARAAVDNKGVSTHGPGDVSGGTDFESLTPVSIPPTSKTSTEDTYSNQPTATVELSVTSGPSLFGGGSFDVKASYDVISENSGKVDLTLAVKVGGEAYYQAANTFDYTSTYSDSITKSVGFPSLGKLDSVTLEATATPHTFPGDMAVTVELPNSIEVLAQ